jgi:hypothetical protein
MKEIDEIVQQIKQELANLTQFLESICTALTLGILKRRTENTNNVRDLEIAFGLGLYKGKYRENR